MNCEDRQDLMPLYLVDALDDTEREALRAHVKTGCPRCAGYLAEAQAVLAHLPLTLEPITPPDSVRQRLLRRVAQQTSQASTPQAAAATPLEVEDRPENQPYRPPRSYWLGSTAASLVAASVAAMMTYMAVSIPAHNQRDELDALKTRIAQKDQLIHDMQQRVETIDQAMQMLRSPSLKVVSLGGTESQPQARGRVFWDTNRRQWHFYADGMAQPGSGKTYELWWITSDDRKIPAGTFDVDSTGRGSLVVDLPEGLEGLALAAVTDEPIGGVLQPTGTIQMVGHIN